MTLNIKGDQYILKISAADEILRIPTANCTIPPRLRIIAVNAIHTNYGTGSTDPHLLQIRGLSQTTTICNDTMAVEGDAIVIPLTGDDTYWEPQVVVSNRYITFRNQMVVRVRDQNNAIPTFTAIYLFMCAE